MSSEKRRLLELTGTHAVSALVNLVDSIAADSNTSNEDGAEPPSKRTKTVGDGKPICVSREHLILPEIESTLSPRTRSIAKTNVDQFVSIRFRARRTHWELTLFSAKKAGKKFQITYEIDASRLSSLQLAALQIASDKTTDPGDQGCLWTSIGTTVQQRGHIVVLELDLEINWNESTSVWGQFQLAPQQKLRNILLGAWLPEGFLPYLSEGSAPSPQDFYESAAIPDMTTFNSETSTLEIPSLQTDLYPFQRRAVQWLLRREGVQWCHNPDGDGGAVRPFVRPASDIPISFTSVTDADGGTFYLSPAFGTATRDTSVFHSLENLKGGILAEEMGLGKTLEIIALISLHERPPTSPMIFDNFLNKELLTTPATLIVTPSSLLDQWLSELARHAPSLSVLFYPGLRKAAKVKGGLDLSAERLAAHDVVLTTYDVLKTEIWLAEDEPGRSMRNARQYERVISPLVQISWWRMCMDEAQMVENWASNAAKLSRKIPRVNAWAITGTPVKDDVQQDLRGLFNFLRYEPYASDPKIWSAIAHTDKESLRKLINLIAMRHTKSLVRGEISIPPQKRYVITMPFSAVEEQHYQNVLQELVEMIGVDTQGNPVVDDWRPDHPQVQSAMRVALDRLRQTALHPEIGNRNRRTQGQKVAPMRTVTEVLDNMLAQSDGAIRADYRSLLALRLTKGQILAGLKKVKEALAVWEDVREKSAVVVSECREQLEKEIQEAKAAASTSQPAESDADARENTKVGEARRRLRSALEVQHRAVFFCANAYFSIKSNEEMTAPDSDEYKRLEKLEVDGYDLAKAIRKEILQESHGKAKALMGQLTEAARDQNFAVIPESKSAGQQGIETRRVVDALRGLCDALDEQANVLDDWREQVIQLLLQPLVDEENEEVTGEEYEQSTKLQEEIQAFLQVLRTALADRQAAITGQKNFLIEHEAKVAIRLARNSEGPSPKKLLELFTLRSEVKPPFIDGYPLNSLRGVVAELRGLLTRLGHDISAGSVRAASERAIVNNLLKFTQSQLGEQSKAALAMEQELELFTDTLNARLDFYRQLQAVSDMVAEYEGKIADDALATAEQQEENLQTKLAAAESKHRYLVHLKESESNTEEQRMCVICQSPFSIGVLTVCGHQFCKECITLWFRAHRNCPVCKRTLTAANLHDITLKPQELKVHSESHPTSADRSHGPQRTPSKKVSTIYSEFNPEKLAEIQNIDLPGPNFTTKVDTLVRHLLWLRESDPGAKSIIFSQYKDFLSIVAAAFKRYRIGFTSFEKPNGINSFKDDPGVEVFLLHARAHASGLNLVNASHVFLCEPLLNTALELQAIARVDRIGQQQETTVWLYIVDGTVEESIYNLSVQRRMEHMGRTLKGKSKESTPELLDENLDAANAFEMQQANLSKLMGRGGISGEEVDDKDLWTCLFGHVKPRDGGDGRLVNNPLTRGILAAAAVAERSRAEATALAGRK
ncbi:putative ATP-dependent helicase IRC20 [Echria macrotheca]|uniref:ATP-dependent helicase IRC20 n=1 Tax=Echria macrotheca TaxID=438768 RepID=A0AAJ0BLJ9_9PEZI|nr:putative ATP-dependent helicase IRC20 [Echria macrotheca]